MLHAGILRFKRLLCRIFGHIKANGSIGTVGIQLCRRCLRITDRKTVRRDLTKGDMERRIIAAMPHGWTFLRVNWKNELAHFADPHGRGFVCRFIAFELFDRHQQPADSCKKLLN